VQIKINLKDGRKDLGGAEIVIKPAYQTNIPTLLPMKVEKKSDNTQQQAQQPQTPFNGVGFLKLLGFGEMLNGTDDDFGGLGSVLAIRDKMIENRFEQRDKEREINRVIEENAVLKHQNKELANKIEQLNGEIDDNEDSISELETKLAEYEKLNPKRDMISGLAGMIAENALLGIVSKTKYAGLLGLGENPDITTTAASQPVQPVSIEAVDDSPRGKAKQQIITWIDTLGDSDFSALYQLLTAFAKGEKTIQSCLTDSTQAVDLGDDDE
jgi:tetrahydromethanopterin S-methyltransferase subunit B